MCPTASVAKSRFGHLSTLCIVDYLWLLWIYIYIIFLLVKLDLLNHGYDVSNTLSEELSQLVLTSTAGLIPIQF